MKRLLLAAALAVLPAIVLGDDAKPEWFRLHAEGWFWYVEPPPAEDAPPPDAPVNAAPPIDLDPMAQVQQQREALERAMALAVLEPTAEHLRAYLQLNQALMAQSQAFAETWKQVVWTTPSLDHGLVSPTGAAARTQADLKAAEQRTQFAAAAGRYGLLFFFRGDCPFCHQFAPVLSRFATDHGFTVIPVSLDGGVLPEYPQPRSNFDAAARLEVSAYPAVYLLDPATRKVAPAVFGAVGYSELAQRLSAAVAALEDQAQGDLDVAGRLMP